MKQWPLFLASVAAWLTAACAVQAQASASGQIVSLRQLKNLTPEQAREGLPVRVKGVVVCYDAGWHQLYVHDDRETLYFNADDFAVAPKKGQAIEITGNARGSNVLENPKLSIIGQTDLPPAHLLELSELAQDHGEWIEIRGRVLSAESSRGRLSLLLSDRGRNCLVYLLGSPPTNDFKQWLNCRVRARGINASRMSGDVLEAGMVFVPGADEVKILEPASPPLQIPVASIGSLLNRELGSWTNQWVHINGLVVSYQPGQSLTVKDPTGVIRARVHEALTSLHRAGGRSEHHLDFTDSLEGEDLLRMTTHRARITGLTRGAKQRWCLRVHAGTAGAAAFPT